MAITVKKVALLFSFGKALVGPAKFPGTKSRLAIFGSPNSTILQKGQKVQRESRSMGPQKEANQRRRTGKRNAPIVHKNPISSIMERKLKTETAATRGKNDGEAQRGEKKSLTLEGRLYSEED